MKKLFGKSKGEEHNFWMSYTDLMSGFLIIFIIASLIYNNSGKTYNPETHKVVPIHSEVYDSRKFALYGKEKNPNVYVNENGIIIIRDSEWNILQEILSSIENINTDYFEYDSRYKRHTLRNIRVSFRRGSSDIRDIPQNECNRLLEAGRAIQEFVNRAAGENHNIKYLLIIEGQSSRDNYARNDELSYERALALVKYWSRNHIRFDPDKCEVIISGSGQTSRFRNQPDNASNRQNQRFVIHIIPKIGDLR
jgi:hypothetical protein